MMHRTQDTYSLTDLREKTGEHLSRLAEGAIETITQNGEAAMIVMSPERYDALVHAAERGHIWRAAIGRIEAGERGADAQAVVRELADEFGVSL
jgi:antitoxin (DNA-binding transcriptional repressor) of toxin-antitoxin stability system